MSQDITLIEKEALNLPTADRAKLAERLLTSLDKPDPDIDRLWAVSYTHLTLPTIYSV